MTHPPCDVILRLPDGAEHAICHDPSEHRRLGRSWSTWSGTEQCLAVVRMVLSAFEGAAVTSPAQARADAERDAIERGIYDDTYGRWLAGHLGIDTRWRSRHGRAA